MPDIATTLSNVVSDITSWGKQPFSSGMGVGGWFLFFGLIVAISVAWGIILHDLKGEL